MLTKKSQSTSTHAPPTPRAPQSPQVKRPILRLQRAAGNLAVGQLLQAKLEIGSSNDKTEREADKIAARAVDGAVESPAQPKTWQRFTSPPAGTLTAPPTVASGRLANGQRLGDPEPSFMEQRFGHNFSDVRIHTHVQAAKRNVSQPGDPDEQEADRMADRIIRMPEPPGPSNSERGRASQIPRAGATIVEGVGQPLPQALRDFFEPRFGCDLAAVRIHVDRDAADSAKAFNALAYTSGRDIIFGEGQFDPATDAGRKLLAHELSHVVQQETTHAVQRQAAAPAGPPAPPATGSAKGILDGIVIATYADVAAFCKSRATMLAQERAAILGEGVPAPATLFNTQWEGEQLAAMAAAGANGQVDDVTYEQTDTWFLSYLQAMNAGEFARAAVAARRFREIQAAAGQGQAILQETAVRVADRRRDAFRSNDDTLLTQLWTWSTNIFDSMLDIKPVIEDAREMEVSLSNAARAAAVQAGPNVGHVSVAYKLPEPATVLPLLEKVNLAIAAIQLVQATADLIGGGKTASAKAQTGVKSAVAIASSVETLVGMANGIGIQLNFYIGPMTDACLAALSKLENVARKGNKDLIERGEYDLVNWVLEPGGRPVFDFMLKVMAAGSAEEVPAPVPKEVASYFVENRSDIEVGAAGGKEGEEVPTTGFWFWRKLDQAKIAQWVFKHRQDLWAIFYGSARPDANR